MNDISCYVRKGVRSGRTSISTKEKEIIEKLVAFYFGNIEIEDLKKLNEERVSVERFLDANFYKELKKEIEKKKIARVLQEKQKSYEIIKILFSEDIKSFEELSKLSNISHEEIKKIFQNKKLILEYGDEIFVELGKKLAILEEEEKRRLKSIEETRKKDEDRIKTFKQYDEFLSIYLNSRYRISDIQSISRDFMKKIHITISSDEFKDYFPIDIEEQLRAKGKELKSTQERKNNVVIRDCKIILLVKPEIIQVSPYILSKLELVADFFDNFGNIERMVICNPDAFPSYNSILSSLMLPELKEYLTEDAYLKLSNYLYVEKMYQSLNCVKKTELVRSVFLKYSGNLYSIVNDDSEEEQILRLLSDKYVKRIAGEEIYNRILTMLEEYKDKRYVIDELNKVKVKILEQKNK